MGKGGDVTDMCVILLTVKHFVLPRTLEISNYLAFSLVKQEGDADKFS